MPGVWGGGGSGGGGSEVVYHSCLMVMTTTVANSLVSYRFSEGRGLTYYSSNDQKSHQAHPAI